MKKNNLESDADSKEKNKKPVVGHIPLKKDLVMEKKIFSIQNGGSSRCSRSPRSPHGGGRVSISEF